MLCLGTLEEKQLLDLAFAWTPFSFPLIYQLDSFYLNNRSFMVIPVKKATDANLLEIRV